MMELRTTVRGETSELMRDKYGTAALPDSIVNQRVVATVWVSSRPDRTARWGVGVWMDREQADDASPFTIAPDGWRGMDGEGLTPSEIKYVAACLRSAADRIENAGYRE